MSDISSVGARLNGADLEYFDKVTGNTVFAFRSALGSLPVSGSQSNAITAHAGGGQGSATALTAKWHRITTVATAADSVVLPTATAGLSVIVINAAAANAVAVFPASGDVINALSANASISVAANKVSSSFVL